MAKALAGTRRNLLHGVQRRKLSPFRNALPVRSPKMRPILALAEDEPDLLEALESYFEAAGFAVIAAGSAAELRAALAGQRLHAAILDITMPGEDGLSLARWIKGHGPVGLILATALGRPIDRVVGLDVGADDYVVKPYDLRELLARLRAVLRRMAENFAAPAEGVAIARVAPAAAPAARPLGSLRLDPDRRALVTASGSATALSPAEYAALDLLLDRAGRIVSRAALAEATGDSATEGRAVDVRIARLRKKIAALDPAAEALLRAVRGEGYVLDPG
jgi:DNA-binding response OmpR family regulator